MDSGRRYGLTSRVIADIHTFVFRASPVWCLDVPLALKLGTFANLMSARREPHTVASHPLGLFGQQPLRARSQSQTQL